MTNFKPSVRKAHLYALMAWSDKYTREQAEALAYGMQYEDLNKLTKAENSITTAIFGIVEAVEQGKLTLPAEKSPEVWDVVIEIIDKIHQKWIKDNAEKYDRGSEAKTHKKLFQHLPTALIGIDELAIDLMFLAPFLEDFGLDAGEMDLVPYGAFKPSKALVKAYDRYVEKYKKQNGIETVEDLSEHIEYCVNGGYEPLDPISEIAEQRIDYMDKYVGLLVQTVVSKNQNAFGLLPMSINEKE